MLRNDDWLIWALLALFTLAVIGLATNPADAATVTGKTRGLHPKLMTRLHAMSRHFRRDVVVTSGCRSRKTNRGVKNSYHLRCMAADVRMRGVSQRQIAHYWRTHGGGGTGTYGCSNAHVDIGPTRQWHWRCKRRR